MRDRLSVAIEAINTSGWVALCSNQSLASRIASCLASNIREYQPDCIVSLNGEGSSIAMAAALAVNANISIKAPHVEHVNPMSIDLFKKAERVVLVGGILSDLGPVRNMCSQLEIDNAQIAALVGVVSERSAVEQDWDVAIESLVCRTTSYSELTAATN